MATQEEFVATFTIRVPNSMTGKLSSAQVRSWLSDFLRCPRGVLPEDPGSGDDRVSLTLPGELVQNLAAQLRCPPSAALRRLAAFRLGIWVNPATQAENAGFGASESTFRPSPLRSSNNGPRHDEDRTYGIVILIEICVVLFVIGVIIFSRSHDSNS